MTTDERIEKLLNNNHFAIEILGKTSDEAHNNMLTRLFKKYQRASEIFSEFLYHKLSLDKDTLQFSEQAKLQVEKVWLDMVGLLIHRNGPALLERSIDALSRVKEAINDLTGENSEFTSDMTVEKHREFLQSAITKMTNLKAAQPSD